MIISHKHKFIFFAVPKTATHSVRFSLREYLGEKDLEQVALFKKSTFPLPQLAKINHGHLTFKDISSHFDKLMINQYFKFGFVRNPYDRFISYYFFTQQPKNILQAANIDRLKNILNKTNIEKTILLRPQHKFLINNEGLLVLDFIGKVETFKEDLYTVFGKLNLPEPQYYQINQSKHFNYLNYYDEELIDMINYYYKYDFELLKYPFAEKIKENKIFQERTHK